MKELDILKPRGKLAITGVLAGLVWLTLTASPLFADDPDHTPPSAPNGAPAHEQMHQMMDALGGEGASQRMHEAMGPESEQLMDQCLSMMGMIQNMRGMMGSGARSGMMGGMMHGGAESGMMGE